MKIVVPPDAAPGSTLEFTINGNTLELVLPEGAAPGDVIELEIGTAAETIEGQAEEECSNNVSESIDEEPLIRANYMLTLNIS